MSFKDLEKKAKQVEDQNESKPDVGPKKDVAGVSAPAAPTKTVRNAIPMDSENDLFDNVPI